MQNDLQSLEAKVSQLVTLYTQSREDAHALRDKVLKLEAHNRQLADKIAAASTRLEALMHTLPAPPVAAN